MYLFSVLKWSVNALLNTCYPEVQHILTILSNETFQQNINNFKGIVENVT